MATEFEELRLSIVLIDDDAAGIKALSAGLRGAAGSATDYNRLLRENTKNARVFGDVVGHVDGKLVLLGGAVGYFSSKIDKIGDSFGSTYPAVTEFARQQQQATHLSQLLGTSIGRLNNLRSQAEAAGMSPADADRIIGSMTDLQSKLSYEGGRTQFQEMLRGSGFRSDVGKFQEYTMALAAAKDYEEQYKLIQQGRKEIEKYAIEKEGMDPELAKEMGIKWLILHGLPAQSVALEEIKRPTKEYEDRQKLIADRARLWLKEVVELNHNIKSIQGQLFAVALSPDSPFYAALIKIVKISKWMADNAERFFAFWFFIQNPNLLVPFYRGGPPAEKGQGPQWPPSWNPLEWNWNPFNWRWRLQFNKEVDDLTFGIQKVNLNLGLGAPGIVPAAFAGGGTGTQGLPGWLQTPGGGGRLPATPGTGTGGTPGTGTGGTPGTPSGPAVAPQAPSGGTPPTGGATPTPRTSTPGTGTGSTPGTGTGGTPGTPNAGGKPQAGELPITDVSAQAGLRTIGDMGKVEGMVIHHTSGVYGGRSWAGVSDVLRNRGFSATFFIDREGKIYRLTPEGKMALHTKQGGTGTMGAAGAGFSNKNMEGVEIEARNDADVLPVQRAAAANLIGQRSRLHGYDPKTNVVGHGELNEDKQRDEGMSTVRRIRSGELSTSIGTAMPTAEPRAPEGATPVKPHPLLGAGQQQGALPDQKDRPYYYEGQLTVGGETFKYGTGGGMGGAQKGSSPYGTFPLHVAQEYGGTGQLGPIGKSIGSIATVGTLGGDLNDPKYGGQRSGIQVHPATFTGLQELYTAGCFAISKRDWPRFRDALLKANKDSGGKLFLTVDKSGRAFIGGQQVAPTVAEAAAAGVKTGPTVEQPEQLKQGGFSPIPPGGLPKIPAPEATTAPELPTGGGPAGRENIPTTSRSSKLDTSNPAIRDALRIPRLPDETDESWVARGRKALESARSAPDRSVVDRALQNEVSAKVSGAAKVDVDVSKSKGGDDDTKDLLKPEVIERQSSMEDAERGPSVEVD